jgi:hypothetical protein
MKIIDPPVHKIRCDGCYINQPYIVEFEGQNKREMIWLCAECIEQAWKLIEAHEETLLAKTTAQKAV